MNGVDTTGIPGPIEDAGIEHGVPWVVMRNSVLGFCCGYVQLPKCHPWHALDNAEVLSEVIVHGGITGGQPGGWIGFDTGHAWDYWPELIAPIRRAVEVSPQRLEWTVSMVAAECRQLAWQARMAAEVAS